MTLLLLLVPLPALPVLAQSTPPCAACVAITLAPDQGAAIPLRLEGLELFVRVAEGREADAADLLAAIRQRGGRSGLLIDGLPAPSLPPAVTAHLEILIARVHARGADLDELAFELKTRLTGIRASSRHIQLGISGGAEVVAGLLARDLGAYIDFAAGLSDAQAALVPQRWYEEGVADDAAAVLIPAGAVGPRRSLWHGPAEMAALSRVLHDLARAVPLLPAGLLPGADLEVRCGDRRADSWVHPVSLDRVALVHGCDPAHVHLASSDITADLVVLSTGDVLVRAPSAAVDHFAEGIEVSAARPLTVEEIIARHQAVAARQAEQVSATISTGAMTLTFEAPGFPAPITVATTSVIYDDGARTEIEQRDIRVNGIEFRGRGVPRLPLLEPERVASPPLAITLTNLYRYELAGRAIVAGLPCHVISFEPALQGRSLFRGRAWIAEDTFAMVRVSAVQTGLRGPIVSSEQVDEFRPEAEGVWLLARSDIRQIYQGPAHRTPIHRLLTIERHEINPVGFDQRRLAAHASESLMLRDTSSGYRYLRRAGGEAARDGKVDRELAGRSERFRTLVLGVIVDPNITRPLPFAGFSYVDLNLLGTGTQLNGFFGGSYGQLAVSVPSVNGTRWQLAGRAFGIASDFNDRAFRAGLEQYGENILQRPAHGSVSLLRPLTSRVSIRGGYELDYTRFAASDGTDREFVVPAHQVVHGLRLALEGQRAGWNGGIWWNAARRAGWRPWGQPGRGDYGPEHRDFQRYGVSIARSAVLTPGLVARGEAVWMSGRDMDRFSRYAFGAFENRLRGYPAALIRYDRGGVVRGAVAWSATRRLRLDGFFDSAYVRDPGFGPGMKRLTGVGTAVETPAPFGTLLAVEWGFGVQGVNARGAPGTHVVRLSGYKMF